MLHLRIGKLSPDQSLGVKDGIFRVHRDLVLRRVPDQPLRIRERDERRRRAVPLVVGDDFDAVMLPHADARVRGPQIDPDGWSFRFRGHD
mmetsp:Transcript_9535/g.27494  ORF Transcript_9535/g.27494 Transcript_9535/m.27494 type:complete len:90 (+) Transcript_9535:1827-2096(+)